MLIDGRLGREERIQRISQNTVRFDILHRHDRFRDAQITVVVLRLDEFFLWTKNAVNSALDSYMILGERRWELPFVELGIVDMDPIRRDSNDRAEFLMYTRHLLGQDAAEPGVVVDLIAIGDAREEGAGDMAEWVEEDAVGEET